MQAFLKNVVIKYGAETLAVISKKIQKNKFHNALEYIRSQLENLDYDVS